MSEDAGIWKTSNGDLLIEEKLPFAQGGFADVSRLKDTDGNPSGLIKKTYTENTGKYGAGGAKYDPSNPITKDMQQKMIDDSIYGSSLLEGNGVLQGEIVGYGFTDDGGYIIQREIGNPNTLPDGVESEKVLADRLKEGPLDQPEKDALADVFRKLDDARIAWEDSNTGNLFLREFDDGTVVAGIHDTDRIGLWDDLVDGRDDVLKYFRDLYATNPVSIRNPGGDIKSMPPGGWNSFKSVKVFNNKMRELKGYWKYDKAGGFYGGHLDIGTVQNQFPNLPDNLPPGWRRWIKLPLAAPPGN